MNTRNIYLIPLGKKYSPPFCDERNTSSIPYTVDFWTWHLTIHLNKNYRDFFFLFVTCFIIKGV